MKKFFLIFLIIVLISFVVAQTCNELGYINGTHYCDVDGAYKLLKDNGIFCSNDYECFNQSCVDGLCQSKFVDVSLDLEQVGLVDEIFNMIKGIECDPRNQTYHCEGTGAFLCGINAVWEPKGEIPGECGVPLFTCGDGILEEPYEQCDDGNTLSDDACKGDCTWNICGDGSTYQGVEQCDDGNDINGDGCNDLCIAEECSTIGEKTCVGYYDSICNDSYFWEQFDLSIGVCGVECLPLGNESCNNSDYIVCNESYVWENLGQVGGKCGVSFSSGGRRGRRRDIKIVIYSPKENIVYGTEIIPLQVIDQKDNAQFWKYSLNGAKKISFIPNSSLIFGLEGQNNLIIYARENFNDRKEVSATVNFNVQLPLPVLPGYCGDGVCGEGELCENCEFDCGECEAKIEKKELCGDTICDNDESSFTCPVDCVALERKDYTPVAVAVAASSVAVLGFVIYQRFFAQAATKLLDPRAGA